MPGGAQYPGHFSSSAEGGVILKFLSGAYLALLGAAIGLALSPTPKPAYPVQTIYVRNVSTFVTDAEVKRDIPAFQRATDKDFAPIWKIDAHFVFIGRKVAPHGAITMTLVNKGNIKGALAYHEVVNGVPDSIIYVGTSKFYGYSWTVGFTHELWEMLVDPEIARAEQDWNTGRVWAGETADPVEADSLGYYRPGADGKPVLISDFITPRWFGVGMSGPMDFMDRCQFPGQILKGGYAQYWDGYTWQIIENFRKVGHDDGYLLGESAEHAS